MSVDDELIRKTYERLLTIRNAQLRYMATRRGNNEFAFLVSPDLVLQFNYVHRIMKSFESGRGPTTDVCAQDGGIMCSNLGVLKADDARKQDPSAADGGRLSSEDYLAGRIVDLLDRPVPVGERALTTNVREEVADKVLALGSLYEERYVLCRQHCDRLNEELSATRQRLEAGEAAGAAIAATCTGLTHVQRMRERIAGYEAQLRTVRRRLETFTETVRRECVDEAEALARRVGGQRENFGEALQRVLRKLFDGLDNERDRIVDALEVARRTTSPAPESTGERRPENESLQEFEDRVALEIEGRVKSAEDALRAKMNEELEKERVELNRRFRSEVDAEASRKYNAHPVLDVSDMARMRRLNDADLIEFKTTLDALFRLKETALDINPTLPRYEKMSPRNPTADRIYRHLRHLLSKIRDLYKFLLVQSEYIESIGATAEREYVPLECMTRQRTKAFVDRVAQITREHELKERAEENEVLAMLNYILDELPRVKFDVKSRSAE